MILIYGDSYLIHKHFEKSPYHQVFCDILPKHTDTLMCLIYHKLIKSSAMQYASTWLRGNYACILHRNADLSSQRISEFLKMLGAEQVWRKLFKAYLEKTIGAKTGVIVDSTGLPNEIDFPLSAWGITADSLKGKQDF